MATIINLFGGPGVGKSTVAAKIFSTLREQGVDCGLITEYATYKILEKNYSSLKKQYFITSTQLYHQEITEESYKVVVTDSPIILGCIYSRNIFNSDKIYNNFILEKFKEKINVNLFLNRDSKVDFEEKSRVHTKDEAERIDMEIKQYLKINKIVFDTINSNNLLDYLEKNSRIFKEK